MKPTSKRVLALFLTLALVLSGLTMFASAQTDDAAYAQTPVYAAEEGRAYDPLVIPENLGDVDGRTPITALDALMALQYSVRALTLDDDQFNRAEVTGEGNVDANDALYILKCSARGIDQSDFPRWKGPQEPEEFATVPAKPEVKTELQTDLYFGSTNFTTPSTVYLIDGPRLSMPEQAMIQSLQGIVAQKTGQGQIFMRMDDTDDLWISEMTDNYGIQFEKVATAWDLVDQFKSEITDSGYVKYTFYSEDGTNEEQFSFNTASTIAGQEGWLLITDELVSQAQEHGLVEKSDATKVSQFDVFTKYNDEGTINKRVIMSLHPITRVARDYGIANKCVFWRGSGTDVTELEYILQDLDGDFGVILGFHNDEFVGVIKGANYHYSTVPSDSVRNWTVTAGLEHHQFTQTPTRKYEVKDATDKHYVTIMFSDGDNLGYIQNMFAHNKQWYAAPQRGAVPVNWTLSSAALEFTPDVVNYLYNSATINDYFIAGFSGLGYMHPNHFGLADPTTQEASLNAYFQRAGNYMKNMDLKYVRLFEEGEPSSIASGIRDILNRSYGSQDGIEGGFIYSYYFMNYWDESHFNPNNSYGYPADFPQYNGGIIWSNGKPFIYCREWLRDNNDAWPKIQKLSEVAFRINHQKRDTSVIEGYTVLDVCNWPYSYEDVVNMVSLFDEDVIAVTADEFMDLIKKNLTNQETQFTIDNVTSFDYTTAEYYIDKSTLDLDNVRIKIASDETSFSFDDTTQGTQGWTPWVRGGMLDGAVYANISGTDYGISLQGTHEGVPQEKTNSMIYHKLNLPASASSLNITAKGENGNIRVKVMTQDEEVTTISDWTLWGSDDLSTKSIDISAYAGETVTIYVEFSDGTSTGNGCSWSVSAIEIK